MLLLLLMIIMLIMICDDIGHDNDDDDYQRQQWYLDVNNEQLWWPRSFRTSRPSQVPPSRQNGFANQLSGGNSPNSTRTTTTSWSAVSTEKSAKRFGTSWSPGDARSFSRAFATSTITAGFPGTSGSTASVSRLRVLGLILGLGNGCMFKGCSLLFCIWCN